MYFLFQFVMLDYTNNFQTKINRPLFPKANGSGQSKKKAKHAAAKAVLDIIIQGGAAGAGGPTSGGAPGAPPEL